MGSNGQPVSILTFVNVSIVYAKNPTSTETLRGLCLLKIGEDLTSSLCLWCKTVKNYGKFKDPETGTNFKFR